MGLKGADINGGGGIDRRLPTMTLRDGEGLARSMGELDLDLISGSYMSCCEASKPTIEFVRPMSSEFDDPGRTSSTGKLTGDNESG